MKTYATKISEVRPKWHVFDAANRTLGRLATEISVLLQGKHNPYYSRHLLTGDHVVVINAAKITVTGGNKTRQKTYYRHSHYPGGLRQVSFTQMQDRHPDRIVRAAVRGMLPKTTLGRHMLKRLRVYAGDSHPHQAQVSTLTAEVTQMPTSKAQEHEAKLEPARSQNATETLPGPVTEVTPGNQIEEQDD